MPDPFILSHIRNLPLFERLSNEQIQYISDAFQAITFQPGMLAFQQGQPSAGMMYIVSGRGLFTRINAQGFEEQVGQISAGEYVNEAALFNERIETSSLRIVENTVILLLHRQRFAQFLANRPEIRANLRITAPMGGQRPHMSDLKSMNAASQDGDAPIRSAAVRLFKGQLDDETVLHKFRRHWWAFARYAWIAVIIAAAGLIAAILLGEANPLLATVFFGGGMIGGGLIIIYLYFEWRDDSTIITDHRVVKIWNFLLRMENTVSEVPLERVLEVNVEIPPGDPFARLFNYGTIVVRTAGQVGSIKMDTMPNPQKIQAAVFAQRDRHQEIMKDRQRRGVQDEIQKVLGINVPPAGEQMRTPITTIQKAEQGLFFARTKFLNADGDLVYRKHFTVWFAHIFFPSLVLLVGLGLMASSFISGEWILRGGIGLGVGAFVILIGGVWFYLADWDWRNDVFIVGEQTVTIIRKRPLWLQSEIDRIRLSQIDNVISDVNGFMNNMLNRGEVRVYLIGADAKGGKILGPLHDPQELQAEISRRQATIKTIAQQNESQASREAMADYIAAYHQTVSQGQQGTTPIQPQIGVPQYGAPQQTQPNLIPTQLPHVPQQPTRANPPLPTQNMGDQPPLPPRDGIRPPSVPRIRRDEPDNRE